MNSWTFVHVTDMHVGSARSFRFAPAFNENWAMARKQIVNIGPDLLLVGGDLTRDGGLHRFELEAIKADLGALPFPYHVVPGNMDTGNKHTEVDGPLPGRDDVSLNLTSAQLAQFESVFGPYQWSFVHKEVRFSGFCDMVAGSGLREEAAFWDWMEAQRRQPRARYHVWCMHSALFIDDPHEPNWAIRDPAHYHDWYFGIDEPHRGRILDVFKATEADIVISGHCHCRRHIVAEGIRFDLAPSTAFPQWADRWPDGDATLGFFRYNVCEGGVACAFVPLERLSNTNGYGPGGHPLPEARDYSKAWDREAPSLRPGP